MHSNGTLPLDALLDALKLSVSNREGQLVSKASRIQGVQIPLPFFTKLTIKAPVWRQKYLNFPINHDKSLT